MRVGRSVAVTVAIALAAVAALAVGSRDDDARAVRAFAMTTATTPAPSVRSLDEPTAVATATAAAVSEPPPSASAPASMVPTTAERPAPPAAARAVPVAVSIAPVAPPAPPATSAPAACPPDRFCYPRLGIAGPIVPYTDCSGQANVGTQIRSFSCLSDNYLMGHAYTSFGRIADWQAGDVVIARGVTYRVRGAFQQAGCTQPVLPLAPLTMQTSLTSSACGPVLIVQAG